MMHRPEPTEHAPFYAGYIALIGDEGPVAVLEAQRAAIRRLATLSDEEAAHRYAEGKWSVKELLGHVADSERVFAYRLLRVARADATPLAGFDENLWAASAPHHARRIGQVVHDLLAVREATLSLIDSLGAADLDRTTEANGREVSGRALCWMLAGHAQHHLAILQARYGLQGFEV
ncbi:MAG: DinB family protein [Acidobacteria bacterium]|nr:DinB family protein [Acidobacteriota bacterium]